MGRILYVKSETQVQTTMDYLLENLGPEKFQEVCHALLAKAFPKTQCFPVGQRDGGRDAISYLMGDEQNGFIVYQVKFVRNPRAEKAPHEWLKDVVNEEAPKVRLLIPKGAKEYYLLTNVPGTAYPESGSIDTVQRIFDEHLDIPCQCWWRDDINRRLDDSWNIKWAYPEILSGPDILRLIIEGGLSEDAERRTSAIRAFVRDQFDRETEVRFKQVELQNKLLDLFIDVPVSLRNSVPPRQLRRQEISALHTIGQEDPNNRHNPQAANIGAASFLLHPLTQKYLSRVVIEGAPGQGKSTVTQYICQIHRSRILNEGLNDPRIPSAHRDKPVRLPFKIDCRDFSAWLSRQNPFSAESDATVPDDWQKSLESFLAMQVRHHSGGAAFSISDLHAIAKLSAVLLVFDGLDEVADISRRREVIEQISKGVNRLHEVAVSVQTVVTSRPAAFANSPGLPEDTFRYFHLQSIDRPLIDQYAGKWLKARRLEGKEASDVLRILKDKLDQPHLRELARNPMQLAILLSLIQTRGGSLPDKRTALYDSYVELFFNRESEKSTIVRDHRDLLIDIHRYLAWVLHAEAQTKKNSGSASTERLRQLVDDYLRDEGHDTSLAQQLFTGMVERVVALVSRVEGTYEFEVQPLREYFAARHLYNTAPYSPPGSEQRGTLPERFDALCRDFFWLNVTRFYAGCYSKGELPSLVDRLEDLSRTPGYRNTSHPQSLAATLLADWVFAQHPRSMKQVVSLILDGIGLRFVTSRGPRYRRDDPLVLPKQSGNEELLDRCFELLASKPPVDYAWMLVELVQANATREEITSRWLRVAEVIERTEKTLWIRYGFSLGILSNLNSCQLTALLDDSSENAERLSWILRGGHRGFIEANECHFQAVTDYLLDIDSDIAFRRAHSTIEAFAQAVNPFRFGLVFQNRSPMPLRAVWDRMFGLHDELGSTVPSEPLPPFETATRCAEIIELVRRLSSLSASDWVTKLTPWTELVERARYLFGDRWIFYVLANTAAAIRSKEDTCEDASDLYDETTPLCRRARYARLRAGAAKWWESQVLRAPDQERLSFSLLILFTWASAGVIEKHIHLLDHKLNSLDSIWWSRLTQAMQSISFGFENRKRDLTLDPRSLPSTLSPKTIVILSNRLDDRDSDYLFYRQLKDYSGDEPTILEFCQRSALRAALQKPSTWQRWLPIISGAYMKGVVSDRYFGYKLARAIRAQKLPYEIAEEIIQNCEKYPTELTALAEQVCRQEVASKVVPVGIIADDQNWFRL